MPLSMARWINIPIMLQKVRRWNSNNQISSCLLPTWTSIISCCQLGTASTTAKQTAAGGGLHPRHQPQRTDARRDVKPRRKHEVRETFPSEEWAMQTWRLGGIPPGKGTLVAAPPRQRAWRRWGMWRRHRKVRLLPAPLPPPLAASAACQCSGEASSPLQNTQLCFTAHQHQLLAPALFETLGLGKFGAFLDQELSSTLVLGRSSILFTVTTLKEIKSIEELTKYPCRYFMSSSLHYTVCNCSALLWLKKPHRKLWSALNLQQIFTPTSQFRSIFNRSSLLPQATLQDMPGTCTPAFLQGHTWTQLATSPG